MPQKNDADSFVRRLAAKGYTARVVPPAEGTEFFRVRVGPYKTKPEAQLVADRVQKDVGITPWVSR